MSAFPRMARIIHDAVHSFSDGRWVATGGGGYQAETVVPRVWTVHFAEMCGEPDRVPSEWFADREPASVSRPYREEIARSVDQVLEACLPRLSALVSPAT
jgi:acetoin utilization deacetylase AcuC-like enzyme